MATTNSVPSQPGFRMDRRARILVIVFILLVFILPLFGRGIDLIVDWIWFNYQGFGGIYKTILKSKIGLSSLASIGFFLFAGANLVLARLVSKKHGFRIPQDSLEFATLDRMGKLIKKLVWFGLVMVAYVIGNWAATHWSDYLLYFNTELFNEADPLLGLDLGFYVFELPFIRFLFYLSMATVILTALAVTFFYLLEGGVSATPKGPRVAPAAKTHLMVLAAGFFMVVAFSFRISMYDLLYSPRGVVFGASYTDVHASMPALWVLLGVSVLTALSCLMAIAQGTLRYPILGVVGLAIVGILGGKVYPEIVQRFSVAPNEIEKETPYIERNIKYTRKGYGLDRFEQRQFSASEDLILADIQRNEGTIRNIRLWDHQPLLTTFAQLQEIRTYYDFNAVDNDRYWIDGTYRQVSLSPRELSYDDLPSQVWINQHLNYTHGYGLCLGPVNESTREGLPNLFIKNIPPVSTADVQVTRPEVYYGEMGNAYCIVNSRAQEFDYPSGDQNVYSTYEGVGGLRVGSLLRRLLFAIKFKETKILLSQDIQSESRVMIYRRVMERAQRLTPFIRFDQDPYMVIDKEGHLWWMLDGYTVSDRFPYSEPVTRGMNYIRNAVKVTVNAYDGRIRFYMADDSDPLIRVYSKIFPDVFEPLSEMPEDLRAHIRYPQDMFSIQAEMYATYHMTDPRVFYNKEDLWRVTQKVTASADGTATPMSRTLTRTPKPPAMKASTDGTQTTTMSPYYTIMKLPEVGKSEEFILMIPFTPARKNNMIAWMAARCDGDDYGKVLVFNFPKQKLVYGPQQIEARIDQQPAISQQLTLWDQGGSRVIRGTLLVIPIEDSILYVEPLYLAAEAGGGLPEMRRVIVSYADQVVMEPSLDEALSKIFGRVDGPPTTVFPPGETQVAGAPIPQPPGAAGTSSLAREANRLYNQAQQKLRQGDLAGFDADLKRLGGVLRRMQAQAQ